MSIIACRDPEAGYILQETHDQVVTASLFLDEAEADHDDFNQRSIATENALRLAREAWRKAVKNYREALDGSHHPTGF